MKKTSIVLLIVLVALTAVSAKSISFSWDPVEGASVYRYRIDSEIDKWTETTDTSVIIDVDDYKTHKIFVQASEDGRLWTAASVDYLKMNETDIDPIKNELAIFCTLPSVHDTEEFSAKARFEFFLDKKLQLFVDGFYALKTSMGISLKLAYAYGITDSFKLGVALGPELTLPLGAKKYDVKCDVFAKYMLSMKSSAIVDVEASLLGPKGINTKINVGLSFGLN